MAGEKITDLEDTYKEEYIEQRERDGIFERIYNFHVFL